MKKYISALVFIAAFVFALESCDNNRNQQTKKPKTFMAEDSLRYTHLKEQFYADTVGNIFEQKQYAVKGEGDVFDSRVYFDSVAIIEVGDSTIKKPLSEIVDIATLTI